MTATIDAAVLALLDAVPNLNVHDGYVTDSDEDAKTISAPLPYVVLFSTPGMPINPRLGSRRGRAVDFTINAVGTTRQQAKWAGQKAEDALDGQRITSHGSGRKVARTDDNPAIRRDDTWTRPDGGPLFVDSRTYSVVAR